MEKETTLVILLDGLRWDCIKEMPFLWQLKDRGIWVGKIFNNGGYCERSCFMTGTTPEVSGNLFAFSLMKPGYKRAYWEPKFNIPLELREKLAMTEDCRFDYEPNAFGIESIWDVLRKEGKTWEFQACGALGTLTYETGRYTENIRPLVVKDATKEKKDFYYWQISETDQWGHIYGTNSKPFRGILRWADNTIKNVVEEFEKNFEKVNLLVFSDHGMMDVARKVNLQLDFYPYVFGWDYLYLKSSAAVQFWVFDKGVKEKILNDGQLNEYGYFIPSPNCESGDLIWQAKAGILVSPCHFHSADNPPKAMHGYDISGKERVEEMRGMAIIVDGKNKKKIKEANLTDICPTICHLLGIRMPDKNMGKCLICEGGEKNV